MLHLLLTQHTNAVHRVALGLLRHRLQPLPLQILHQVRRAHEVGRVHAERRREAAQGNRREVVASQVLLVGGQTDLLQLLIDLAVVLAARLLRHLLLQTCLVHLLTQLVQRLVAYLRTERPTFLHRQRHEQVAVVAGLLLELQRALLLKVVLEVRKGGLG